MTDAAVEELDEEDSDDEVTDWAVDELDVDELDELVSDATVEDELDWLDGLLKLDPLVVELDELDVKLTAVEELEDGLVSELVV